MRRINLLYTAVVFLVCSSQINAQDWPRFLGPNGNSTSPQKGLLRSWPDGGPSVLWTTNVGPGYGGPVIQAGKVYLLDRDDNTGDIMRCFDFNTGKELWKSVITHRDQFHIRGLEAFRQSMATGSIPAALTVTCTASTSTPINLYGTKT